MRDEVPPVNLVASRIPRSVIENIYNITLPSPKEGEDPDRPPTCEELLNTYGCKCRTLTLQSSFILQKIYI